MHMRLLMVITTLDRGGAETQVAALAGGWHARGWQVEVVSLLPAGAVGAQVLAAGIPVHSLGMRRGQADPRAIMRLARRYRAFRPDVVHSHMVHANLLARVARLAAPVPLLACTAHSIDEEGWWREAAYRLTDPLCDVTTNVGLAATDRYRRRRLAPPHKLECIPNGIDTGRFAPNASRRLAMREALGLDQGTRLWVAIGRLDPPKDPVTLVQAFARHAAHDAQARLVIVGGGVLEPLVRAEVASTGMTDVIELLGPRDDIPELLAAADAFVLSSRWEGLPVSVLEAGAAELPIVATAVPGTLELVEDGVTGVLAEPGNAAALAAAMGRVAALPEAGRRALGQAAAKQAAARYSLAAVLDQWQDLFARRSVAGRSPRQRQAAIA